MKGTKIQIKIVASKLSELSSAAHVKKKKEENLINHFFYNKIYHQNLKKRLR